MKLKNYFYTRAKNQGSSLIEVTVITLLVAVSIGFSLRFVFSVETELEAKQRQAREDILLIKNAIGGYTVDLEKPAPMELNELVKKGYFDNPLIDPWGSDYQYQNPGQYSRLDVWSKGPDGIDSEDDIVGWDPYGSYVR